VWWNQLNAQEKGKAMSDFLAGHSKDLKCECPLEDANEMTMWDNRITVVDQFPLFFLKSFLKHIPEQTACYGLPMIRKMWHFRLHAII